MSVTYSLQAATANGTSLLHILFHWKGSIWKLLWKELILWFYLFCASFCLYFFVIQGSEMESSFKMLLGLSQTLEIDGTVMFLLSYLIFNSMTRWSETYKCLCWPENIALLFQQHFNEKAVSKQEARNLRNTIVRYLTAFYILVFRDVSTEVRQWFPTFEHLVESKILTKDELRLLQSCRLSENSCRYWVTMDWIALILKKKYQPKYIFDKKGQKIRNPKPSIFTDIGFTEVMTEMSKVRAKVGDILAYDWVPLPLAFIQTITIFVYSTILLNSWKMQEKLINLKPGNSLFTEIIVQSISTLPFSIGYLSFLRISQVVINPFGLDDDDFETPYLIQRHFNVLQEILCNSRDLDIPPLTSRMSTMNKSGKIGALRHTLASAMLKSKIKKPKRNP